MTGTITMQKVYDEIQSIRKDVRFLKSHMIDIDTVMTEDDELALKEAIKESKEGKTVRL